MDFFDKIDSFRGAYYFLSNFYLIKILYGGIEFPSTENAYQAMKSFDTDYRIKCSICGPGVSKRLGKTVELREDWEDANIIIMYDLLKQKFQNPDLQKKLLSTGRLELIEGNNWHDNFWGDCHCDKCKNIVGQNRLGKLLMKVRSEIFYLKIIERDEINVSFNSESNKS